MYHIPHVITWHAAQPSPADAKKLPRSRNLILQALRKITVPWLCLGPKWEPGWTSQPVGLVDGTGMAGEHGRANFEDGTSSEFSCPRPDKPLLMQVRQLRPPKYPLS